MEGSPSISVVVPVYNEEAVLNECHKRISKAMLSIGLEYEILFVDDGSTDRTPGLLEVISAGDSRVRAVLLSRNFGHQAALSAGIDFAKGDAVVTLDADLQDPPELIPQLVERWRAGAAIVQARRTGRRGDGIFKRATSFLHYRLLKGMADVPLGIDEGDFRLLDRRVCDVLRRLPERDRYLRGLVAWAGFAHATVPYIRQPRHAGRSHYRLSRMVGLALDGIFSFSFAPLRAAGAIGLAGTIAGLALLAVLLARGLASETASEAWPYVVALLLFCNGITLLALGILGEYVGRIYREVKDRPLYIVRSMIGFSSREL